MAATFIDDFAHNYSCAIGEDLNGTELYFPPDKLAGRDGPIVRVVPNSAPSWTGMFAFGQLSDAALTGVFSTPDPHTICVVAKGEGYWVSVLEPSKWQLIKSAPVLEAHRVPHLGLILFADDTEISAYGNYGLAWTSERLSLDGFKINGVEQDCLSGSYFSRSLASEQNFTLDLATGKLASRIHL